MDALPVVDQPVEDAHPETERFNRRFSASPVEGGLGLRALRLARGRLTLEVPLRPGESHLVQLAVAIDTAIGIAVHSAPAVRIAGPTLDLRLDPVAEPAPEARVLVVEGEVLGAPVATGPSGVGRALVRDDTGRVVAHAIGTMVVEPLGSRSFGGWWDALRELPRLDAEKLVRTVAAAAVVDGALELELDAALSNPRGTVHGGLVLAIGRLATERITGIAGQPLDTAVEYLRPLPLDGVLTCRSVAERTGRRFVSHRTELVLPDGRTGAVVRTATAVLSPAE